MSQSGYFSDQTFAFLRKLKRNNNREWFKAHQDQYEAQVREPALRFIAAMDAPLKRISPNYIADDRKVGGSLFRIQRDTRFAKDKTPYKTAIGIRFNHERARDVHSPLFYLHIEEGDCFAGAGLWRPDGKQTRAIREFIVANPNGWKQATRSAAFKRSYTLGGEALKRPPRGFDAEHELIDDLMRKDFVASVPLRTEDILDPRLPAKLARHYQALAPMVEYLCDALDVDF